MYNNILDYQEELKGIISQNLSWDTLRGKRLLIAGATGMIGTVLVDVLMLANRENNLGCHVYAMGRTVIRARERFSDYWDKEDFDFIQQDINEPIHFDYPVDYIIHAASNTHPRSYVTDPVGSIMTNLLGTYNLLEYARRYKLHRFIFLSSVEIYGRALKLEDDFDEHYCGYIDCNTLRAGYPEGKRAGEALCQAYIEKYGFDIIIPRLSRVFGPTMLPSDSKAMAQFIHNAVKSEPIVLKSEGNQQFSYTYAPDAVSAILTIMLNGNSGEAYNVANVSEVHSLKEIATYLARLSGQNVTYDVAETTEKKGYSSANRAILKTAKLEKLGWRNRYTMYEALSRTFHILGQMLD